MDNAGDYPTVEVARYISRSNWDVPNRFSLGYSYLFPSLGHSGFLERLTGGFTLGGTTILQQGGRFSVFTTASFQPTFDPVTQKVNGLQPSSGDFNGDGVNFDFPDVSNSTFKRSRQSYLSGVFPTSRAVNSSGGLVCGGTFGTAGNPCGQFSLPAFGAEGNEIPNGFRDPGFAQSDIDLKKTTKITERVNFELRLDVFNVFNRVNLTGVDGNANDGSNFGKSLSQRTPRNMDVGARINF